MKVIQSRIFIEKANGGSPIQDRTSLLVWILSALYWKKLGHEVVLYTDTTTKEYFDSIKLSGLYNSVELLDESSVNEEVFWASSKLLAAKKFMNTNPGEEFIISDLDFVPFVDPMVYSDESVVAFYHEYVKAYAPIEQLKLNEEYKIPDFFTGSVNPINVCQLYIPKKVLSVFSEFIEIAEDFMTYNYSFESGPVANDLMLFIEQRLFAEYLKSKNIEVVYTIPKNKSIFNTRGFHTGPYKNIEKVEYWEWIIWYFKMLKDEFPDTYDEIINLELYADIKSIVDNGKGEYTNKRRETKEITEFQWDTLNYPKAFEDIYDKNWNS